MTKARLTSVLSVVAVLAAVVAAALNVINNGRLTWKAVAGVAAIVVVVILVRGMVRAPITAGSGDHPGGRRSGT
jgi:hypothetical protein